MKNYTIYSFLILVILLILYSCQTSQGKDNEVNLGKQNFKKKTIEVNAQVVKKGSFFKEIISNGILTPCRKAKLVFKTNENISNVYVVNGQRVTKGQVLVQLDTFNQMLNLEKAHNLLLKADIELKDLLLSHRPNSSNTEEVNAQVLETLRSRSGFTNALFVVREAKFKLSQTKIVAPFDGVISNLQVKENNDSGNYEFFAYVLNNQQMELEFGVMESELAMIKLSADVILSPYAFPNKKFKGKISEINPAVDESGMIKVKALISNTKGILLDGMNAEVLIKKEIANQFVVPKEAILLRQERQMLFTLLNDSIAQWVYVKTGLENTNQYTVIEGIKEDDIVIISNNFNLGHDVKVKAHVLK